jgi:beta-fructofuranosidase
MLYRPEVLSLWDTTLFFSEGGYHLFFLQQHGLGHAVSVDLANWSPLPDIDLRGNPGEWNEWGAGLTGCVVEHEGRFALLAGSLTPDTRESVYGAFFSDDLVTWVPFEGNPVLRAPAEFGHDPAVLRDGGMFNAWRDPSVVVDADGVYHAYLCARSGPWTEGRTGSVVAHASSRDLLTWEHHDPILWTDRVKYTEVPGVFELEGRHYVYFLDRGWGGLRIHTPSRESTSGTYYMVAASPEGPYEWPADPLLIGRGHDRLGAVAARVLEHEDGLLLYHHTSAHRSAFAPLKQVRAQPDGSLYLQYFPAIEALETGPAIAGTTRWAPLPGDVGVWRRDESGVAARSSVVGSTSLLAPDVADLHVRCVIRMDEGARAGVVVRSATGLDGERERRAGVVITLDFELQRVRLEVLEYVAAEGWSVSTSDLRGGLGREFDTVTMPLELGRPYLLRCFVRAEFVEVYLDDRWVFSTASATHAERGDVELYVERGEAAFTDLRIAELTALD